MLKSIIQKYLSTIKSKNKASYESLKISIIYSIIGLAWIFSSDRVANFLFNNKSVLLMVNTYKGFVYIFVTAYILYVLIYKFLKRIFDAENELKKNYIELEAYTQQLNASQEELSVQYEQIVEDEEQLIRNEEKNRAIIQAIPDVLFMINSEGIFLDCETNDENKLRIPKEHFIGKSIAEIMPKEVSEIAYKNLRLVLASNHLQSFEYMLMDNNVVGYYEIRMVKKDENEVLAIMRDTTKRKELENRLEYLSYHDQLTGLHNRRFYEEELIQLDIQENLPLTIVLGDMNGLKLVNDSFGHTVGDELIRKVAGIIKKGCREDEIIARYAGDEFIILLPKTDSDVAEQIIKNINKLAEKEKIQNIDISISFGYETKRQETESIQEVFTKAEDYMYKRKLFESSCMRGKTVHTIMNTLNEKNKREQQHSVRVSDLCKSFGEGLGLTEQKVQELKTAGLLHDIGKIAIDDNILNKEGKLTDIEYSEIKRHPEIGYRILSTVTEMSEIADYILLHHERWNGTGYPKGLAGLAIPFEARIIAIADAYDAMTSERTYRKTLSKEYAIEEIKKYSGIQFDPELVKVFVEKVVI